MREQKGRPNISLPLQGHSEITEEPWERPSFESSIPLGVHNARHQPSKTGPDYERDHEHIERIDDERKPTLLEIRRASLGSSTTVDTVEFVRKLAAGDRKLPITTASATTDKPQPNRRKRGIRRIGIVCSALALITLIVIPVVCVCILTGVFVPDEAREEHGKVKKVPQQQSKANPTTTVQTNALTTDSPDVTWLAAATKTSVSMKLNAGQPDVTWLATPTETSVHYILNTDVPPPEAEEPSAAETDYSQDKTLDPSLHPRTLLEEAPTTMETRRALPSSNGS